MTLHLRGEFYHAVLAGKKRVVGCAEDVCAGGILGAALADDNLPDHHFLAVLKLDPKPFGYGISS